MTDSTRNGALFGGYGTSTIDLQVGDVLVFNGVAFVNEPKTTTVATPEDVSDKHNSSTGFFALPVGTTLERPLTPSQGYARVNTTEGKLEVYVGTGWVLYSGGA